MRFPEVPRGKNDWHAPCGGTKKAPSFLGKRFSFSNIFLFTGSTLA
jgi:hypothetical protein